MTTTLIFTLLGAAMFHAVWNTIIKGGSDKLMETVMKACSSSLLALFVLPFLPTPAPASWPYLAATVCIHTFYYLFLANAYRGADMSYAYTLMRGTAPLLTALVTVFILHDTLSAGGWLGVLLLSLGILMLTLDCARCGVFNPLATALAMGNALVIMGYTVVDGSGVRLAGQAVSYIFWMFFLNILPLLFFVLLRRKLEFFRYVRRRWKFGLAGGLCSNVAYGLSIWAMSRAPISLVAALRETSVVFGMLMAVIFLKERMSAIKISAVLLVLAGAICVKVLA